MGKKIYSIIKATGSYIPTRRVPNSEFLRNDFYDPQGEKINDDNEVIVEKFQKITGISE